LFLSGCAIFTIIYEVLVNELPSLSLIYILNWAQEFDF
jgi:hypothetical protein